MAFGIEVDLSFHGPLEESTTPTPIDIKNKADEPLLLAAEDPDPTNLEDDKDGETQWKGFWFWNGLNFIRQHNLHDFAFSCSYCMGYTHLSVANMSA